MSDSSEKALFKICAQLQKEIQHLKEENDEKWITLFNLEKSIKEISKSINVKKKTKK